MERGTGLPGTPHTTHTYICCCRTAEAAMLPPPQCSGSNQLQWVVQWRSTWYGVVQYGTLWYTRAAPPLTYAAAVWPQLSEEQQQLPRSGRLTHIYISTYLNIYNIYAPTYLRKPGTGTFQTKSPQFGSMTCQFTCQQSQNMAVDILFELRNLLILVASSQMSKTNEI